MPQTRSEPTNRDGQPSRLRPPATPPGRTPPVDARALELQQRLGNRGLGVALRSAPHTTGAGRSGLGSVPGAISNSTTAGVVAAGGSGQGPANPDPELSVARQPAATAAQASQEAASGDAGAIADRIYEALDGWNNEERVIGALTGHEAGTRAWVKAEFERRHGQSLAGYLADQLDDDALVKAFALLESSNVHEPHTRLALALIPTGTRDEELMRILEGTDHAHRLQIRDRYDQAFASIGEGSLEADLKDDLSGWQREKCLALMNRDLTKADDLYFLSVGIAGTNTDSVVQLLQQTWRRGPADFQQLEWQWEQYVRNGDGDSGGWTDMSLREAMDDELSGEEWDIVVGILKGYERLVAGAGGGALGQDEGVRDQIDLDVEEATLAAATIGGYTGAGTNESQVYGAIERIRDIWLRRIARAVEPDKTKLMQQWADERARLTGIAAAEMDTEGAEYQRARLLLSGALTPADEVWLASRAYDSDRVTSTLTKAWGSGGMSALLVAAAQPKVADGTVLRPRFDVMFTVPVTSGTPFRRVAAISREDQDDAARGAGLLKIELDEGDDDSDLRRAYGVLSVASDTLRSAVVRSFAETHLGNFDGETPTRKFLNYIAARYENSAAVWDCMDLLDPAAGPNQMLERAQGRLEASRSGLLDAVLEDYIQDYDELTGEDTRELAEESLARLRWIAQRARPDELAVIAALTEKRVDQLAQLEYSEFQKRLEEIQALKHAIADAIATAGELAISAVLTVATGGAASGLFVAALASAVAGMVVREALLGQQYELMSKDNAARLAGVVAGAALGSLGSELFQTAVGAERLQQLSRVQAFMQEATQEAFSQVGTTVATQAFSDKVPTAEDIAAGALAMFGSAAGAGVRGSLRWTPSEVSPRVRQMFLSNLAQATISQTGEQLAELARSGTGDLTGPEISGRFARRAVSALQQSLLQTAGDVGAQAAHQTGTDEAPATESADIQDAPGGGDAPGTPVTHARDSGGGDSSGGSGGGGPAGEHPRLGGYTAEGMGTEFVHGPLPEVGDVSVEHGRGSGLSEGERLTSYAEAVRSPEGRNPATAAAREEKGPYIRDNLYTGTAQKKVVRRLKGHGILEVSPDADSVRISNPDRYLNWLERAYRRHGEAHLDPRMREAIRSYVASEAPLVSKVDNPHTGGKSFAGALPGTHAELLAINDLLVLEADTTPTSIPPPPTKARSGSGRSANAEGATPSITAHVATVRATVGGHFAACVHCGSIIDQLAQNGVDIRVWSGRASAAR